MKKIFIVILNYNGFADTAKCLPTLYRLQDKSYSLEVVVVDNGSNTEQLVKLKKLVNDRRYLLIENGKNLGFAKGNNVGIKYALDHGVDYVLLLNNDTEIVGNFLKDLLEDGYPLSAPAVRFREFKDHPQLLYDLGGYVNWTTGRTTHLNCYSREFEKKKKEGIIKCDYVAGCSLLIKREVLEKVGLLDEKYFIYFEDVDFCVAARKYGFKTVVDPRHYIIHKLGGSMDRWSGRAIYRNLTGNFIFITKHLGWHRVTGYTYLFILTAKIIIDRLRGYISKEIR